MTKSSKKKSSPTVDVPDFKNPQQKAEWFDANRGTLMEVVSKFGKWVEPRQVERTRQLTLRVAVADLERAPAIAKEKGIGYQTVLKQAIREGLKEVYDMKAVKIDS